MHFSSLPCVLHAHPSHLELITLLIYDEAYKLWSSPLCRLFQLPDTSSLLGPNVLKHPQSMFFLPCVTLRNKLVFHCEEFLAALPIPKLEDHPFSAVCDCLFNIFTATLHICGPSLWSATRDAPCRGVHKSNSVIFWTALQMQSEWNIQLTAWSIRTRRIFGNTHLQGADLLRQIRSNRTPKITQAEIIFDMVHTIPHSLQATDS
jgi:hypothetical protein